MTTPGRNAPCPCGSGRKFKHCCLSKQITTTLYTGRDRSSAFAKLVRFSERDEFSAECRLAEVFFDGARYDSATKAPLEERDDDEQTRLAFLDWFLLDHDLVGEGTVAQRFLATRATSLSAAERVYLERMAASCLRPYEIAEVRPDEGLALRDLWTDDVVQVRERLATRQLARWDILATRVVPGPDTGLVLEGIPWLYPPDARDEILAALRGHHRRLKRELPSDDSFVFFKRIGMVFHHLWLDLVASPPLPTVMTPEGDLLAPTKALFDVKDHARVLAALAKHPALDRQEDGSFVWLQPTESFARVLGTITLGAGRLTLETMSEARSDLGRQFLEQLLGDAILFRVTSHESLEHAIARPPQKRRDRAPAMPPELERAALAQFYDEHYRTWPDIPLPALGGRTPRHAAGLKTVRPKLEALLRQMENRAEHERLAGRPGADLSWLWGELGLERT